CARGVLRRARGADGADPRLGTGRPAPARPWRRADRLPTDGRRRSARRQRSGREVVVCLPSPSKFDALTTRRDTRTRDSHQEVASGSLGSADDQRANVRRPLRKALVLDLPDGEAVGLDRCQRVAVAVAAARELLLEAVEPVLPAREPRLVRAHVLEEEE